MTTVDLIDGLLTAGVSLVLVVCWLDNLARSTRLWMRYTDARSFRAWLIAVLLALAALSFLGGAIAVYLIPELLPIVRSLGLIIRGAFLVVGIFTFVSWRRRRPE